jgi:hypothetical protein
VVRFFVAGSGKEKMKTSSFTHGFAARLYASFNGRMGWWFLILGVASTAFGEEKRAAPTSAAVTNPPPVQAEKPKPADAVVDLFDGRSLQGWTLTDFAGHGEVRVESLKKLLASRTPKPADTHAAQATGIAGLEDSVIVLEMGALLTGINYTNEVPKINYEVTFEAMRLDGSDFFCGFTFPVNESHCSLIVGGWGGGVVGISSLDGLDASENETTKFMPFQSGRWYAIRVRVTPAKLEAWLDQEKVVDVKIAGRKISLRSGDIELSKPFGLAAYQTVAALRNLQLRRLP